ncbi:MAG: hypothetical protein ABIR66_06215 [Saprospiraceae bacterium]
MNKKQGGITGTLELICYFGFICYFQEAFTYFIRLPALQNTKT